MAYGVYAVHLMNIEQQHVTSGPWVCLCAAIVYTRGGQTFSMEGHIENFSAVGGPHIHFVCFLK